MFLRVMELLLVVLVILFVASQVLMPLWQAKPLFPFFRKKVELEMELKEVEEEKEVADLEARIAAARGEVQKKRKLIRRTNRLDS